MQVVQYQRTGSMGNLANLGIEMDGNGQMSLNQDTLNSLSDSQISAAFSLFGFDASGLGGLQRPSMHQRSDHGNDPGTD